MELGNKIATLRKKMEMTQKELADILSISAQSISKWETGQASPDVTMLPKIAEIFGVSIDELFDLTISQKLNRIENVSPKFLRKGCLVFFGLWGMCPVACS